MPKERIDHYPEEEEKKSGLKIVLSFLFFLLVVGLLLFYWFLPTGEIEFISAPANPNFSISGSVGTQFYENMRFPDPVISYRILDCPLQRTNDMDGAFEILSNLTSLSFNPVAANEEISIICQEAAKIKEGIFIAGEGGPTNITKAGSFNVIIQGQILLLKDSDCTRPNIAIHETLHVLGFDHSVNKNNIMYNITNCDQTIGEDLINLINELYSVDSLPDLSFEDVTANIDGRYLNTNISIRNQGLRDAGESKLVIYVDGKSIKEVDITSLRIGYGRTISLSNLRISKLSVDEIEYSIETDFSELDKKNNRISLNIKS